LVILYAYIVLTGMNINSPKDSEDLFQFKTFLCALYVLAKNFCVKINLRNGQNNP